MKKQFCFLNFPLFCYYFTENNYPFCKSATKKDRGFLHGLFYKSKLFEIEAGLDS